ncbi:MAG TPA: hypothetical protein VLD35_03805 [Caldimonas sp.]|nr:hypothetical protein [Caldimonas sp.]
MQAMLDLIASHRARMCDQILGEAHARAQALRSQAGAAARTRMRQAFDEQRQRRRERIAAAEARLANQRRLHEQQRLAASLRLASEQLPSELKALWQQGETRAAWVRAVLAAARLRLREGPWHIVHAAGWSEEERERLVLTSGMVPSPPPRFDADPGIVAGLKIISNRNVLDGTIEGLLSDPAEFEARLLRRLEASSS